MAEMKRNLMTVLETAAAMVSPVGYAAFTGIKKLVAEQSHELEGKSRSEALEEAERLGVATEMIRAQARAEQELAIADRIRTAAEVEIEDHYDSSGKGGVGLDFSGENIGLSGAGHRVIRRIIRLKGWPEGVAAALDLVQKGRGEES